MTIRNLAEYFKGVHKEVGKVWYPGTDAIKRGQGLCYAMDYVGSETGQAATDAFQARGLRWVEKPDNSNNLWFAGVAIQDYPAREAGQQIDIAMPGGCAEISIAADPNDTLGDALVTALASSNSRLAGMFVPGGFRGRGSALLLEAPTTKVVSTALDGSAASSYSDVTGLTTITKTGIGTACGSGVPGSDPTQYELVVLGGAKQDGTALLTPGVYPVTAAPSANTITVTGDTGDTTGGMTCVVRKKEATVLAYLMDGEESGLAEFLTGKDNITTYHPMIGGVSFICGGYTTANGTGGTLAGGEPSHEGIRKALACLGTLTTGDFVAKITSGLQNDGATDLATLSFDAANEMSVLQWNGGLGGMSTGGLWLEQVTVGAAIG